MTERAAHLVDAVPPRVPVRQWVLSLPRGLRYLLAWDHGLCRSLLGVYAHALLGWQRRRAGRVGVADGRSGSVMVVHRFGGALNLNIHFHTLTLDGVFTTADSRMPFHPTLPPTDVDQGPARMIRSHGATLTRLLSSPRGREPFRSPRPPRERDRVQGSVRRGTRVRE